MNSIDVISNIVENPYLLEANLKYCLVDENKLPFKQDGVCAHPDSKEDFVDLYDLLNIENIEKYKGVGISIQASNIWAIDVDHCFKKAFDVNSWDDRGKDIINRFKDIAYIEFSFSGTGLRILFKTDNIKDYANIYYIKNTKTQIEYYQPSNKARYVTITGKSIYNNRIKNIDLNVVLDFLDKYMKRLIPLKIPEKNDEIKDNRSISELMNKVKYYLLKNYTFQDNWFEKAPGSGSNESERDYYLITFLYENVTQDKDKIKEIFEQSEFFKTKDYKHINKWKKNNYDYLNYLYSKIRGTHNGS